MPGIRTAAQLVRQAREHAQETSAATYRDGFAIDPNASAGLIAILSFVNQALNVFCLTGAAQATFTIPTVANQRRYTLPQGAGTITSYSYLTPGVNGAAPAETPIRDLTIPEADRRNRTWRSDPPGLPHFQIASGQFLDLYPTPAAAGQLVFTAHALEPDLILPTDTPQFLPARYHDGVGMLAAMLLCASDADNPARATRVQELMQLWQMQDSDLAKLIDARAVIETVSRPGG